MIGNQKYSGELRMSKDTGLGKYDTPEGAFEVYKRNKELLATNLAYKYKETIDERVFQQLLRFKITDKR